MRLFVLGNGFDLAHNIASKYWDFGEYLEMNFPKFYNSLMAAINNDQGIWSDFESSLPECGSAMEDTGLYLAQERLSELDYDPMSDEGMGIWMDEQLRFIRSLPEVLRQWIQSVDIDKPRVYKDGLFTNDDLYLTFNYTNTLEKLYCIKKENILHIHGDVEMPYQELIMGHGNIKQIEWVTNRLEQSEREFSDCAIAVYKSELEFLKKTMKNTSMIISNNEAFFMELMDIDEVVVIGSSLSAVDKPYFEQIHSSCLCKWTFVYYESKNIHNNINEIEKAKRFAQEIGLEKDEYKVVSSAEVLK